MGLVKKLILPAGLFLVFSAGSTVFKLSDINDANLSKKYNTPAVERVLELEKEFSNMRRNRKEIAESPGKYLHLTLEYTDSLQNSQTMEDLEKIPDPDRENNDEGFYIGIACALASLGWGFLRTRRYINRL